MVCTPHLTDLTLLKTSAKILLEDETFESLIRVLGGFSEFWQKLTSILSFNYNVTKATDENTTESLEEVIL